MGIRKPKEPKKILEELVADLARDYARWNEILEHGGSDRFYPDGTGLELKRNHVINDRLQIAKLCEEHGLALPEGMRRFPVPPEMPQNYMARNGAHFSERVRRIRELDPGFEPVFGTCAETGDMEMNGISENRGEKGEGHTDVPKTENRPAIEAQGTHRGILPIPCTVGFDDRTVKDWFQKVNEELDELKEAVLVGFAGLGSSASDSYCSDGSKEFVAEEAADTITAITSMLEAMGIGEGTRQEAQRRVNKRNRERGRIQDE